MTRTPLDRRQLPIGDGGIIQGPKADIMDTHDVDPIDSPVQNQDAVLIDVPVGEETRTLGESCAATELLGRRRRPTIQARAT